MFICTLIAAAVAHHIQEGKEEEDVHDGESWDDFITRRTREFNTVTRERPGDESVWLDFANFQVFQFSCFETTCSALHTHSLEFLLT